MKKQLPFALFDMDGTLVDSMTHWMSAPLAYARRMLPTITPAQERELYLTPIYEDMQRLLASWGVRIGIRELIRECEDAMLMNYRQEINAKRGTIALLEALRAQGVKMGVVTMTPHHEVEICLARCGLDSYFSFVLTTEDTSDGSGKEKPEIFELALSRLGCESPADCMFFEDSLYAVKTAHELGFYVVGVHDSWAQTEDVKRLSDEFISLD